MEHIHYDVIVVGAGPAGVAAAAGVARTGASVLLLEAGAYAGAENWSGCVYFAENLVADEIFGADAMTGAPFERPVVKRGIGMTDGHTLLGVEHRDPATFANCYTVLRPAFDPYWASLAEGLGATFLADTTVTSLIREGGRVTGVHTNRGPAYANVVFLAEGDASHLIRHEQMERVHDPDFMQGVKAVYKLAPEEIERRFGLHPGEGAANELLVRNASLSGRSVHLNMGAFIYTNRDSLSVGYVVPLKNLADHYKGAHEDLLAYVTGLPGIAEYLEGAELSAFGAKLIRTGGVTQSPRLVEDGLAVGGSACGLGIDIPCPNFTGPASATGRYFAQAFAELSAGGKEFSTHNLTQSYLERVRRSRYWADAEHLSRWPHYMETSKNLFGVGVDFTCGMARHLTAKAPFWTRWWRAGRLLRDYLPPKRLVAMIKDDLNGVRALRLADVAGKGFTFSGLGRWVVNSFAWPGRMPGNLAIQIRVAGEERGLNKLPLGLRGLAKRMMPAVGEAMAAVYRNDDTPIRDRMGEAASAFLKRGRLLDLLIGLVIGAGMVILAVLSGLADLLRYYVFKVPVDKMLADPVAVDSRETAALRELEKVDKSVSMAGRLATNTYLEGDVSHIRVLWPDGLAAHHDLANAPYWSVCPAGVYSFEPSLAGHGTATVDFQNCIKCESCWQSSPVNVRWGRTGEHSLIYRPDTPALDIEAPVEAVPEAPSASHAPAIMPVDVLPDTLLAEAAHAKDADRLAALGERATRALSAFEVAVANVPPVAEATRLAWPRRVGEAALHRLRAVSAELSASAIAMLPYRAGLAESPFVGLAARIDEDLDALADQLRSGELFEAVAVAVRIRDTALTDLAATLHRPAPTATALAVTPDPYAPGATEAALRDRFPDTTVKGWDTGGLDDAAAEAIRADLRALPVPSKDDPVPAQTVDMIRAWSAIHPGAAIPVLAWMAAKAVTGKDGGAAVMDADLAASKKGEGTHLSGTLVLVPSRLADHLVLTRQGFAYTVPLNAKGVGRRTVRAGGLHPAAFETITLDVTVTKANTTALPGHFGTFAPYGYAAVAAGAGDYLSRRTLEQAEGRIQFPGQMQDTQGHDSIAKFGAVKALVARTLAWRDLVDQLLARPDGSPRCTELAAAVAAMAFCPKNGRMSYDAGQTFGGTGYSEDDQLARFYRDSATFAYLAPGYGALERLAARWGGDAASRPLAAQLIPEAPEAFSGATGSALSGAVRRWQKLAARTDRIALNNEPARESLALTIGLFYMLTGVYGDLEAGRPVEGGTARIETLLGELSLLLDRAEREEKIPAPYAVAHFPELPDKVKAEPLAIPYKELVARDDAYASGDFLRTTVTHTPQFVPEIQLHDPDLRKTWSECYRWFIEHCDKDPDNGGPYEHYIERLHAIPPEMLEGFVKNGFFATVVPKELDGLGWKKIGYYLLVSGAMRYGDASLSLLIMASTSIGTTPALIGLDKELPLVDKELSGFADDPALIGNIQKDLDAIVTMLERPDPGKLSRDFKRLVKQVDKTLRRTKVVKYLAQNFMKSFYTAALAGQRKDFAAFAEGLKEAQELLRALPKTVQLALGELPRRRRAAEQFLTWLGHGGVAAFALTEPTAGSDSGGVSTVGHLKSVDLTPLDDGRYRFEIDGEERFLIDADKVEFDSKGMAYRLPDGKLAHVSLAGYDYATDKGVRTLKVGKKDLPFHDIAQVRDGNRYEFYEVSGAKMWITNGRVCTQFSMYIKTDEGITGIMVDRHAEGLIVGRDEEKMGQQGSPTNEIAIDRARVPRENIIGYEGHGQVNALETLNVGRCGLAVASVVMGRRLLTEAMADLPESEENSRVLGEVAARVFANESLVYHLIGRFDNYATESVRMESAVAKYACSEMFHEALDKVEALRGPAGQTRDLLVEKMRRDARILNIYEGTNEVQRFLIWRELCGMVKQWRIAPAERPDGWEANEREAAMARYKDRLRKLVAEVDATLGDAAWQDAAIQHAFFPLAEMAGELYLLDTTLNRLRWLDERKTVLGDAYTGPMTAVGERAADQCLERLDMLEKRYRHMRPDALVGRYPAEAVAADAALEEQRSGIPAEVPLNRKLSVVCIVRPVAVPPATPRLDADGRVREKVWRINPSDAHALARMLAIKQAAEAEVSVRVIGCGGARGEALLREALAAGADAATLLPVAAGAAPALWADAMTGIDAVKTCDLLIAGDTTEDVAAPLAGFVAGRLGRPLVHLAGLAVTPDGGGIEIADHTPLATPAVLTVRGGTARLRPTLAGHVRARQITIDRPKAAKVDGAPRFAPLAAAAAETEIATSPEAAARMVDGFARLARSTASAPYDGSWSREAKAAGEAVWAVAQGHELKGAGPAFKAARQLADQVGIPARALVTGSESRIRRLAGLARDAGLAACYGIETDGALSTEGRLKLIAVATGSAPARLVAPAPWADAMGLAGGGLSGTPWVLDGVTGIQADGTHLGIARPAYGGKLTATVRVPVDSPLLYTVPETAEFPAATPAAGFSLARGSVKLSAADLDPHFIPPKEDLTTAEVIVDVGYGAGTPEGMKLAEELMETLSGLGLSPQMGATRKVTQGLGLLPQTRQIGQTGLKVNPLLIICLGISGAPQHVDYVGSRAQLIALNKDPDAPIMGMSRPGITVHPVVGDLFTTVPALIDTLGGTGKKRGKSPVPKVTRQAISPDTPPEPEVAPEDTARETQGADLPEGALEGGKARDQEPEHAPAAPKKPRKKAPAAAKKKPKG